MSPAASPPRLRNPAAMGLLVLMLALFGWFALDLLHDGPLTRADDAIGTWLRGPVTEGVMPLLVLVTRLHTTLGICLMALAVALALLAARQMQWLPVLVMTVPGGLLLNSLVKQVFERARPVFDTPLPGLTTYSFPSGHTAGATVWWGFVLVLVFSSRLERPWRAAAVAVAVALVSLTALSRVALGFHHPSDVLAAVAEGVAWLVLCFMVLGSRTGSQRDPAAAGGRTT